MCRVGQNRIYTLYITIYLVISKCTLYAPYIYGSGQPYIYIRYIPYIHGSGQLYIYGKCIWFWSTLEMMHLCMWVNPRNDAFVRVVLVNPRCYAFVHVGQL